MLCLKCGENITTDMKFCKSCGTSTKIEIRNNLNKFCSQCGIENLLDAKFCVSCGESFVTKITFFKSISICMNKYFQFNGRASRSEYWYFFLFTILIDLVTPGEQLPDTPSYADLVNLIFIIPLWAVGARRLHDINYSGWWQLLSITFIGIPYLIYLFAKPGEINTNKYG